MVMVIDGDGDGDEVHGEYVKFLLRCCIDDMQQLLRIS